MAAGAALAAGASLFLGTLTLPAQGATQFASVDRDRLTIHDGRLEIKEDGAVIDGLLVRGYIDIKADNVTIRNSIIESSGTNSIRVYAGAQGARILNSKVLCQRAATNGVVYGNYTADRVDVDGCRNDFLFSASQPATITNSSVDGVAFSNAGPTTQPTVAPTTPTTQPTVAPTTPTTQPTVAPTTPTTQPTVAPTTPTTQPTVAPTTPTVAPTAPAPAGFPNASNTGVPAGVALRPSGSLVITVAGTVIDGLDIRGSVEVRADNVTIRNSRVSTGAARYPIRVFEGVRGVLIDHVEVSNEGGAGKGIYFSGGTGTVRYSNIHSAEDGIFITADNVVVEHNYIHDQMRNAGAHPDAIQIRGGDNIVIRNNNLQAWHPRTGVSNAAIQIGSLVGDTIDNLRVTGNLMDGGRFTINGGGRGEVASAYYEGNRFGRRHQYAPAGNLQNSTWASSNVYLDNNTPAIPER